MLNLKAESAAMRYPTQEQMKDEIEKFLFITIRDEIAKIHNSKENEAIRQAKWDLLMSIFDKHKHPQLAEAYNNLKNGKLITKVFGPSLKRIYKAVFEYKKEFDAKYGVVKYLSS